MESRKYCLLVTNLFIMFTLNILKNYKPFLDVHGSGKFVKYLIERIRIITQTYLVWVMLHKNINKCAFSPFVELKILLTLHCLQCWGQCYFCCWTAKFHAACFSTLPGFTRSRLHFPVHQSTINPHCLMIEQSWNFQVHYLQRLLKCLFYQTNSTHTLYFSREIEQCTYFYDVTIRTRKTDSWETRLF